MVAHPLELVATWSSVSRKRRSRATGYWVAIVRVIERRDLALHLVDPASLTITVGRRVGVVGDERGDRGADRLLDEGAHPQDVVLDRLLLASSAWRDGGAGRGDASARPSARA